MASMMGPSPALLVLAAALAGAARGAGVRGSAAGPRQPGIEVFELDRPFKLHKRYDLSKNPAYEWDVVKLTDQYMTHSCANYTDDGTTVFSRDNNLVLKVASACKGGGCLNSGRIMTKEVYQYGVFKFTAKLPKCNRIWPALWLLPNSSKGDGEFGPWPCSGEIDVLETVHDDTWGAFNLVAGYGSTGGPKGYCAAPAEASCNACKPPAYCTSTTLKYWGEGHYFVEDINCSDTSVRHPSWKEHTFVLNWQPDKMATWIDPELTYDEAGNLIQIKPNMALNGTLVHGRAMPSYRAWFRETTPTWTAVGDFMQKCHRKLAHPDAPFNMGFKLVLNIAIGGYGGAPCTWGSEACTTTCGGAIGSEMVVSDVSVWERIP